MFIVTDLFELHFIGPFWFLRSKLFGHFGGIKGKKVSQRDKVNLEALFEIYRYRSCEPSPLVVRGEPERKGDPTKRNIKMFSPNLSFRAGLRESETLEEREGSLGLWAEVRKLGSPLPLSKGFLLISASLINM